VPVDRGLVPPTRAATALTAAAVETPDREPVGGFNLSAYLAQFDPRLFGIAECRRALTKYDPLLFALLYLPHHLRGPETGEQITLSEFHTDVIDQARRWAIPAITPGADRDVYVGPRSVGKSTWFFLILPCWAAAHGHRKFIAAFADSGAQAELHLKSFKSELRSNELLREDYPDLCAPARTPSGGAVADHRNMFIARSGFVFGAKGVDASSLGMKVGRQRPDLIILDDIEPDESNYSPGQKEKRLSTLQDAILPLNIYARVVLVGTVTMPGSIVHDLVRTVTRPGEDHPDWVGDDGWRVHYYAPILTDEETGERRSLWPAKWSLAYLESIEHTRSYRKNYANDPMARDGTYWNEQDFHVGLVPAITHQVLSIDPAVTSKAKSDYTALAVVAYSAHYRRVVVRAAWAIRVPPGEQLRKRVLAILEAYPETRGILVETNQGGDTWKESVLAGLPVKVKPIHQTEPKEVRAARLLARYQTPPRRGLVKPQPHDPPEVHTFPQVVHEQRLPAAEGQMVAFPKGAHDDLVDAIGTACDVFLGRPRKARLSSVNPNALNDED
jgi:hypothetical protein